MSCFTHLFLPFVNVSCVSFPHAARENTHLRVMAMNSIAFNLSASKIDPLFIDVNVATETIPSYLTFDEPSSAKYFDKLVGVAIDGVPMYSGLSSQGYDVFQPPASSGSFVYEIDGCGGSFGPTPDGWRYHYRAIPACVINNSSSSERRRIRITDIHELLEPFEKFSSVKVVGYSTSGRPIYSPLTGDGRLHANLDSCNGKFDENQMYGYYTTISFPYIMGCEGPGIYNTVDLHVTLEQLPSITNVRYDQCPGGSYPATEFETIGCILCPAGKYSITTGSSERLACSGICPEGYYCPEGSVRPIPCPGGKFGVTSGLKSDSCSGSCQRGYFCPPGSTRPDMFPCGNITYYCPEGSPRRLKLPLGYFSLPGDTLTGHNQWDLAPCDPGTFCLDGKRFDCPAGRYGKDYMLSNMNCTAACPLGHYCPPRTVSPVPCPAGTFGDSTELTNSSCSGLCLPGYYCRQASVSSQQNACAAGTYGGEYGLTSHECSPFCEPETTGNVYCRSRPCSAGFICPAASTSATQEPCGGPQFYCPPHSVVQTVVDVGYYSVGPLSSPLNQVSGDELHRTSQVICEAGYWCSNGTRYPCSRGMYGSELGLSSKECNGLCSGGYICDVASSSPTQYPCGLNASVFCPPGSYSPVSARPGFYTVGNSETTRSHELPCPSGMYCINGVRFECPAGRYSANGSPTADCDGLCEAGYYCPPMSSSSRQLPCPPGRFGVPGMTNSACTGGCTEGYYCPQSSTSPFAQECGSESVYCPRDSGEPQRVSPLHYSTGGTPRTRTAQELCIVNQITGTPPAGNIRSNICPSTTLM